MTDRPRAGILAVDGGNSKTDVALVAADGRLLAALRGPTTSHQQVGLQAGADRLASLVATARERAGLDRDGPPPDVGVYALAGADTPTDTRHLAAAIAERRLAQHDLVINDAFAPIRVGSSRGWGVALICGSGVNAAGIAPDGRTARLAALGGISGDWGGGHDVGLAALGAAVRARDGRGPRTLLEVEVPRFFDLGRPIDVTRAIERGAIPEGRLRDLAPLVFAVGARSDPVARSIIDRLADELVAMATAIIRRLHLTRRDPDVVMAGGLFEARDEAFEARISAGLRAVAPAAVLHRSAGPPVLGAALLALDRLLGSRAPGDPDGAEARLRAALRGWRPVIG